MAPVCMLWTTTGTYSTREQQAYLRARLTTRMHACARPSVCRMPTQLTDDENREDDQPQHLNII